MEQQQQSFEYDFIKAEKNFKYPNENALKNRNDYFLKQKKTSIKDNKVLNEKSHFLPLNSLIKHLNSKTLSNAGLN